MLLHTRAISQLEEGMPVAYPLQECSPHLFHTTLIPQEMILSSMLFNIYVKPVGDVIRRSGSWCHHQYADHTQLYLNIAPDLEITSGTKCCSSVLSGETRFHQVTPTLQELCWFPVVFWAQFRVLFRTYKIQYSLGSGYLKDHLTL